jgi:hypothetical protein
MKVNSVKNERTMGLYLARLKTGPKTHPQISSRHGIYCGLAPILGGAGSV